MDEILIGNIGARVIRECIRTMRLWENDECIAYEFLACLN